METPDTVDREGFIPPVEPDRAPIHPGAGKHDYVPSEFRPEIGRCDICGGGPDAEIHQKPVDHVGRIADALERIADYLDSLVRIADNVTDGSDNGGAVNVRTR